MVDPTLNLETLCYNMIKDYDFFMNFVEFLKGWKTHYQVSSNKLPLLEEYTKVFFIPSKKVSKAKLIAFIEKLPTKEFIIEKYQFKNNFFDKLVQFNTCVEIRRENTIFLLLTPEGFALFDILKIRKKSESDHHPSVKMARMIQEKLYIIYRKPNIEKVKKLSKTIDTISLSKREIATVLFFFLNGNISKDKEYDTKENQLLRAIPNYVIHAFKGGIGRKLNNEERENVVIRLFEKDLFHFSNEKLFSGIFNEESKSYIQENKLKTIENLLFKSIKKHFSTYGDFLIHWKGFLEEFLSFRSVLSDTHNFYYSKAGQIKLLNMIEESYNK